MSTFLSTNHMFLRNPHGGVENVEGMKAAGFGAVFCNIKDYPLREWDIVRERAHAAGVPCGPWARTTNGDEFEPSLLLKIIEVAESWGNTPFIVNSEAELKGSGSDLTQYIANMCQGQDWALSMEPWPFANVDWTPIEVPVLPQCFGPDWADAEAVRAEWQRYGVRCVVPTFGTYSAWSPDLYPLDAPYGLYTADDCGNDFARWKATGKATPCGTAPPTNGGTVPPGNDIPPITPGEKIGPDHGITAVVNWLQAQPGMPVRNEKYDPAKPATWPWPERLERTLKILAADHDNPPPE